MKNSYFKSVFIVAAMFLLLAGTGTKSYAQYTIYFNASNGYNITVMDVANGIQDFIEKYEMPPMFITANAVFNGVVYEGPSLAVYCIVSMHSASLKIIDDNTFISTPVFIGCGGTYKNLTTVDFPNVTEIGDLAFVNCNALTNINIPNAENVGRSAFYNCKSLTSINLPLIEIIEETTFMGCSSLEEINFPRVFEIGDSAFDNCTSLEKVNLPELQGTLKADVFADCYELREVYLDKIERIEDGVFENREKLKKIGLRDCESIGRRAFLGCTSLSEFERYFGSSDIGSDLPHVTEIGNEAFSGCKSLTNISIGSTNPLIKDNVTIGEEAFLYCKKLEEIICPDATSLGNGAFKGCENLIKADFPEVIIIGNGTFDGEEVFAGCESLEKVDLQKLEGNLNRSVFEGCNNLIQVDIDNIFWLDAYTFENRQDLTIANLKEINEIGDYSFRNCFSLNQLTRMNNSGTLAMLETIGNGAFQNCLSLQYFPHCPELKHIGEFAFSDCISMQEVNIPKVGSNSIGAKAFSGCTSLRKVTLGTGLTEPTHVNVANNAFDNTSNIDLFIGENVLPKREGNSWNGYTWKSITVQQMTGMREITSNSEIMLYPNPAKNSATVSFELASACEVRIALSDVSGKVLIEVYKGAAAAGEFIKTFDTGSLTRGVYFLTVSMNGNDTVKKLIVDL